MPEKNSDECYRAVESLDEVTDHCHTSVPAGAERLHQSGIPASIHSTISCISPAGM